MGQRQAARLDGTSQEQTIMYDKDERPFYEVHDAYIRRRRLWSNTLVVGLAMLGCGLMLFAVWEVAH